ncbi:Ribbon-helix-helix protein, copG family [Bifidobacterium bohemicum]|uniref:Ribbon-helix-helix domain protein n=1 Tax=Bifidobacterium bohemicum DSM 22767 TaxID=1437606 RepID=A0A086ZEH1_9BIFI|nr:ribbon-helix-helix protein, CopG family [Bifidobacterium bohemicum]KFI44921.1 ribbon-helix-helix domain protein [Bifidobacterium bohemicum DSM 22767]SCB97450.1 Ribbon-helix-helix protein, copG family [Bifidobacterium bohemicum]
MNDEELYRFFGTTENDVDRTVDKVETGDYSDFDFSRVMQGRPMEKERMETVSAPVAQSRVKAMNRAAKAQGISRSEFIRRAIDRELMALS